MALAIGASQPGEWAIGASQPDVAAAPSGGQVIMISKDDKQGAVRVLFAGACMVGKCNRRDFCRKAIVAATTVGV